jgi:hypothetical protein
MNAEVVVTPIERDDRPSAWLVESIGRKLAGEARHEERLSTVGKTVITVLVPD